MLKCPHCKNEIRITIERKIIKDYVPINQDAITVVTEFFNLFTANKDNVVINPTECHNTFNKMYADNLVTLNTFMRVMKRLGFSKSKIIRIDKKIMRISTWNRTKNP